jgi:hypothetical protein
MPIKIIFGPGGVALKEWPSGIVSAWNHMGREIESGQGVRCQLKKKFFGSRVTKILQPKRTLFSTPNFVLILAELPK